MCEALIYKHVVVVICKCRDDGVGEGSTYGDWGSGCAYLCELSVYLSSILYGYPNTDFCEELLPLPYACSTPLIQV